MRGEKKQSKNSGGGDPEGAQKKKQARLTASKRQDKVHQTPDSKNSAQGIPPFLFQNQWEHMPAKAGLSFSPGLETLLGTKQERQPLKLPKEQTVSGPAAERTSDCSLVCGVFSPC